MENNNLQEIFDVLLGYLPKKWKKVALYSAASGNMTSTKFYVDCGKGYIDCFHLDYDKTTLIKIFFTIESILSAERKGLTGIHKWTVFTMFVNSKGKVEANYDYTDISETYIDYHAEWEKKNIFNTSN